MVEYLVSKKADTNVLARGYQSGTPLHCAARNGLLDIVKYLSNQTIDIDVKNKG